MHWTIVAFACICLGRLCFWLYDKHQAQRPAEPDPDMACPTGAYHRPVDGSDAP